MHNLPIREMDFFLHKTLRDRCHPVLIVWPAGSLPGVHSRRYARAALQDILLAPPEEVLWFQEFVVLRLREYPDIDGGAISGFCIVLGDTGDGKL